MWRILCAAFCFAMVWGSAAHSAVLLSAQGTVMVNSGAGFRAVTTVKQLKAGDRISVGANGSAKIAYDNGCVETIGPSSVVIVKALYECRTFEPAGLGRPIERDTGGSLKDAPRERRRIPILPIIGGGVIIACLAAICDSDDKPASP